MRPLEGTRVDEEVRTSNMCPTTFTSQTLFLGCIYCCGMPGAQLARWHTYSFAHTIDSSHL